MNDQNDSNASSDAFQANRLNNSNKVTPLISTPFISESLSYDNDGQPESSHKYCKICFESSSHISQMISPCKCNGSLKWVHENCLKS